MSWSILTLLLYSFTDRIIHDLQRMNAAACVDSPKLSTGATLGEQIPIKSALSEPYLIIYLVQLMLLLSFSFVFYPVTRGNISYLLWCSIRNSTLSPWSCHAAVIKVCDPVSHTVTVSEGQMFPSQPPLWSNYCMKYWCKACSSHFLHYNWSVLVAVYL